MFGHNRLGWVLLLGLGAILFISVATIADRDGTRTIEEGYHSTPATHHASLQCNFTLSEVFCTKSGEQSGIWKVPNDRTHQPFFTALKTSEHRTAGALRVASDGTDHPLHDCTTCHQEDPVLSPTHPPTAGMTMGDCKTCHVPDGPLSLVGTLSQSHTHFMVGAECATCHRGDDPPDDPGMTLCLECHGPLEALAAKTADVSPTNPHDTPHGSPFAECSLCHLQHEPPQNFCASCHDFEFNLP